METLILGWYILIETQSIFWLTAFGSLQFMGTLIAPWLGVVADRLGRKFVLCCMRAIFVILASILMLFAFLDVLTPTYVLILSLLNGMLRPSDLVMRQALVGDTVPKDTLANALGLTRISMESARLFGALIGTGIFALLGISYAYILVVCVYFIAFALSLGITNVTHKIKSIDIPKSQWRDFKEGVNYVLSTPAVLAIIWLAFLVNLTAFPIIRGLFPFVAKEIYFTGEIGLGHMVATFAAGALIGSLIVALAGPQVRTIKFMFINIILWYLMLAVFASIESEYYGLISLLLMGIFHSQGMVSMSVILISRLDPYIRGRVIGIRVLAIYGVPLGLLGTGYLINAINFQNTINLYIVIGIVLTISIWFNWRKHL